MQSYMDTETAVDEAKVKDITGCMEMIAKVEGAEKRAVVLELRRCAGKCLQWCRKCVLHPHCWPSCLHTCSSTSPLRFCSYIYIQTQNQGFEESSTDLRVEGDSARMCRQGDRQAARCVHGVTGALLFQVLGAEGLGEAAMYFRHSSDMAAFASGMLPSPCCAFRR
jgi:hypothetical protein